MTVADDIVEKRQLERRVKELEAQIVALRTPALPAAGEVREAIIRECEQAARGPIYKEIYNGWDGHNWHRDTHYGKGRHAAADAVAALALPQSKEAGEYHAGEGVSLPEIDLNSALGSRNGLERRTRPELPMGNAGDVNAGETTRVTAGETAPASHAPQGEQDAATRTAIDQAANRLHKLCGSHDRARLLAAAPAGTVGEALKKVIDILEKRAEGYASRSRSIFNGTLVASELRSNIREIRALASSPLAREGQEK